MFSFVMFIMLAISAAPTVSAISMSMLAVIAIIVLLVPIAVIAITLGRRRLVWLIGSRIPGIAGIACVTATTSFTCFPTLSGYSWGWGRSGCWWWLRRWRILLCRKNWQQRVIRPQRKHSKHCRRMAMMVGGVK